MTTEDHLISRRHRQRSSKQWRAGLVDNAEHAYRDEAGALHHCRVYLAGAPKLQWWAVDFSGPGGSAVAGTERLLTDSLREKFE